KLRGNDRIRGFPGGNRRSEKTRILHQFPRSGHAGAFTRIQEEQSMSTKSEGFRIERDSMGELQVPADALWGAQTQRAVQNFRISGLPMPRAFIRALGLIKAAAAEANADLGLLDGKLARAIQEAALEVAEGRHDAHFPID